MQLSSPRRLLLTASVCSLATCGGGEDPIPEFVDRPTQVVIDPDAEDFWSLPIPSDRRQTADGSYGLVDWPGATDFIDTWLEAADTHVTNGWGLSSGVFMPLGGPIDTTTLPADPAASRQSSASVFLLDVDADSAARGERIPLNVSVPDPDHLVPENLLAAIPVFGFLRRPETTYALVITNGITDGDGVPLGRSRSFHDAFEGAEGADPDLSAAYGLVRATLTAEGFDLTTVVGAAVFTTMDPDAMILRVADWTETLPAPTLSEAWQLAQDYDSYQVLTGAYESPVIQSGDRPYTYPGEGDIIWDASGDPEIQDWQRVRLVLTIPKQPQPADGFPLTMFLHGSGGNWYQAIDRSPLPEVPKDQQPPWELGQGPAEWLAQRGVATLCFDFPLHGNRNSPSDTTGLMLYNLLSNPGGTIYNFNVSVMELLRLSRLTHTMTVDATLSPNLDAGAAADNLIRFDPDRLTAMGQSMGTTIGIPWAGVDPRLKGAVWSGTGGMLIEIGVSATEPVNVNAAFSVFAGYEDAGDEGGFHRAHPTLHALQNMWDLVDPVVKAPRVVVDPNPGIAPKQVMMTAGFRDGYFHPNAQAAVAVPLGVPLVGDGVESILTDALALADRPAITYPVTGNIAGTTAAVVHYAAPHDLGHYVVFNQEGARYQFTCFLASVGTAAGAVLPEEKSWATPCP